MLRRKAVTSASNLSMRLTESPTPPSVNSTCSIAPASRSAMTAGALRMSTAKSARRRMARRKMPSTARPRTTGTRNGAPLRRIILIASSLISGNRKPSQDSVTCRARAPAMSADASKIIAFMWATTWFNGKRGACALALVCSAAFSSAVLPLAAATRVDVELNSGWKFEKGEGGGVANLPTESIVNETGWQSISLPHCWGWEDAQRGRQYYRGPGWYWRRVDVENPTAGRRYFLRFEAAGSVAEVYFNGKSLGQHRGAFGAFCFEITRQLSATGTNSLAVRVSNAAEPDVTPLSG